MYTRQACASLFISQGNIKPKQYGPQTNHHTTNTTLTSCSIVYTQFCRAPRSIATHMHRHNTIDSNNSNNNIQHTYTQQCTHAKHARHYCLLKPTPTKTIPTTNQSPYNKYNTYILQHCLHAVLSNATVHRSTYAQTARLYQMTTTMTYNIHIRKRMFTRQACALLLLAQGNNKPK